MSDAGEARPGPAALSGAALEPYDLTEPQRAAFRAEGYLVVPGAVPGELVLAALRAIHASFGKGFDVLPYRTTFRDDVERDPSVLALLTGASTWAVASELVGRGKLLLPPDLQGQVLPHFPVAVRDEASVEELFGGSDGWHIDGMSEDRLYPCTIVAGIALSDTPEPSMGQLVVWPGTHLLLCEVVRARGPSVLRFEAKRPSLAPHAHVHLRLRAGDAVFMHPMLAHSWSRNLSPHVRHMVYYRLTKTDHERERPRMFSEPFSLFEGV